MIKYASVAVSVPLRKFFTYSFDDSQMNIVPGIRVNVSFNKRKTRAFVISVSDTNPFEDNPKVVILPILKVIDKEPIFGQNLVDLSLWMESFYFSSRGEILDTMIPGGKKDVVFGGLDSEMPISKPNLLLSEEQQYAISRILEGNEKLFYLYGITGSGKTEVFLRCAQEVIAQGGQVIYLVPEITLTHQLAKQVKERFKGNVAVLHSAMTDAQRITQWRKIKKGEVNLVIGARSAVFAPCDRLKLIIIDEEHENSYKSGNDPRYHARQVAQKRLAECGGKLLMGSATPSLEAWYLMQDPSKIVRLDLTKRLGGGSLPLVSVAQLEEKDRIFGKTLIKEMVDTLSRGKQVILFLNRRGFSYYFHCRTCGYEHKCPHCDVAMTYHKRTDRLVCHYCGHTEKPVKVCPECGSYDVMYAGFGTEQVEQETKTLFPGCKVARLDTDIVSKDRTVVQRTLDEFAEGKTDILIGTQMVAKGLNFPNVELVGVVLPDSGLLVPDFRAQERTFDLLVQVSGRSGRSSSCGKVVVQTRLKDNPAITYAQTNRVSDFFDGELNVRKQTGFPPFSRMINIVIRGKKIESVRKCSGDLASVLRKQAKSFEVFGEQPCPLEKVRENYRYEVLLRSSNLGSMQKALEKALSEIKITHDVYIEIDVDPLELL